MPMTQTCQVIALITALLFFTACSDDKKDIKPPPFPASSNTNHSTSNTTAVAPTTTSQVTTEKFQTSSDSDGDTVRDWEDNCAFAPNTDQGDDDDDGMGNLCDPQPQVFNYGKYDPARGGDYGDGNNITTTADGKSQIAFQRACTHHGRDDRFVEKHKDNVQLKFAVNGVELDQYTQALPSTFTDDVLLRKGSVAPGELNFKLNFAFAALKMTYLQMYPEQKNLALQITLGIQGQGSIPLTMTGEAVPVHQEGSEYYASATVYTRDTRSHEGELGDSYYQAGIEHGWCETGYSPLVLDLGGDGISLTGIGDNAHNPVLFDMEGKGKVKVATGWVNNDSEGAFDNALLALPMANDNQYVDNAQELFGTAGGDKNGFDALKKLDSNSDGTIDKKDDAFPLLMLWVDKNMDGMSQTDELRALDDPKLGDRAVQSISLTYTDVTPQPDNYGNEIHQKGTFTFASGKTGEISDVWFKYAQ